METSYRVVNAEYDEKEYLRRALIDLSADVRTPDDILESKFDTPSLENRQVIAVKGVAHLNYSAEVGTDRKVNTVTDRGANVTKTVTDWRPVSGQYSAETYGFSENCNDPDSSAASLIATAVRTCKRYDEYDYDDDTDEPLEPCNIAINKAKADMLEDAESKCRHNIGTQVRHFKCDGHVEPDLIASYVMPRYSMEYEYKGEKYTHLAYAAGKFKSSGTLPDESKNIEARIDRLVLPLFILSLLASMLSIIFSLRSYSDLAYEEMVRALVPLQIFFVISTVLFLANKFSIKIIRHLAYNASLAVKKKDLIAKLSALGLQAPTDSELAGFKYGKNTTQIKASRKRIIPTVAYVVCCILFAFKLISHSGAMMFSLVMVLILLVGVVFYNVGLAIYRIKRANDEAKQ